MKMQITVHGVAYDVEVDILDDEGLFGNGPVPRVAMPQQPAYQTPPRPSAAPRPAASTGTTEGSIVAPIAGTVKEIKVSVGDEVAADAVVMIVEAMKMNTDIATDHAGKVKKICVSVGDSVREGQQLVEFE
jgi:biotin carboxyl carrier protein